MKKKLAISLKWLTSILTFLAIIASVFLVKQYIDGHFNIPLLLVLFIVSPLLYYSYNARDLLYDDHFLYSYKNHNEKKIPLQNIKIIKPTKTEVAGFTVWKIKYQESDTSIKTIRFFPYGFRTNVFDFAKEVKKNNPNVQFITGTFTFDFDK